MKTITQATNLKVLREFSDDHLPCVEIEFKDQDGETHKMELCWLDREQAGSVYFEDSPKAQAVLLRTINDQMEEGDE